MKTTKSLKSRHHQLSETDYQLEVLNGELFSENHLPNFQQKLESSGLFPLKPLGIEIFQMNVGYMPNGNGSMWRRFPFWWRDLQLCRFARISDGKEPSISGESSCTGDKYERMRRRIYGDLELPVRGG